MKNIIIFGSGDHAQVIFWELIEYKKYKIIGFFDETKKEKTIVKYKNKNYKSFNSFNKINNITKLYGIIGAGTSQIRKKIFLIINKKNLKIKWEKFISKYSVVKKNVKLGNGCMILSLSLIHI